MAISTRTVDYTADGETCEGYLALPEGGPAKLVLIAHAWGGQGDVERGKADRIAAELGYAAFCMDVYGKGKRGETVEECQALMTPMLEDRAKLQARLNAAVEFSKTLEGVDTSARAAAGYCFGGLCVLDMARAGQDVAGVASFHGLFGAPDNLSDPKISAKVVAFHGWDDPMAEPDTVLGLAKEMSAAGADWQLHAYGNTLHAFTTPGANDPNLGVKYDATADQRSWQSFAAFLKEVLG
ncbi:MAG: dienelactone hydrolase family protein [Hyphomonadaceae bacterium]|nr:dienelactone hydrolase family protein [Hyphomonadaceae bacterium]